MCRYSAKVPVLPFHGVTAFAGSLLLACLAGILILGPGAWCAGSPHGSSTATGQVVLTDPWNMPVALSMIPAGSPTLLFVCDPSERRCREGAVYFDSKRALIEEEKVRPVCVLVGSREAAREAAARMSLTVPVYVDAGRNMTSKLIGQEIMPALVLLDGKGNLVKVIPGGGEALDSNITVMLEARPGGHRMIYALIVSLVLGGALLLIAD